MLIWTKGPNTCTCGPGYKGDSCQNFDCSLVANCSGNGTCSGLKKKKFTFNFIDVFYILGANACSCFSGYAGSSCQNFDCALVSNCNTRGSCSCNKS